MNWGYGGMGGTMLLWGLLWILIVAAIVWVVTRNTVRSPSDQDESPETILKRRYASGELSREEYDQRLTDLRK